MTELNPNKQPEQPEIPYLRPREGYEISRMLTDSPYSEVHKDTFGVEVVNGDGSVSILRSGTAEARKGQEMQTVLARLPLLDYEDDDGRSHEVNLYARHVSGYYSEVGGAENTSLFVVDQLTDNEGRKRLAATPGLLHRENEYDIEESQLALATLTGLGGANGIKEFIKAKLEGADTADAERALEASLRKRGFERTSTYGFNERSWSEAGFLSEADMVRRRKEAKELRENESSQWNGFSPVKKMGAWLTWKMDRNARHMSVQDAYFTRQRRKDKNHW